MKIQYLISVFFALLIASCSESRSHKTILVILAHPDDETTIGPVMARQAKSDRVVYIIATDGRYGSRNQHINRDSLAAVRKAECECSKSALGVDSLIMLGFHDALGAKTGIVEYFKQMRGVREALKENIEKINPDLIITFGPDGDTGHHDHRVVGNLVTEVLLREAWVDRYPLYYLGWTKAQAEKFGITDLGYLDEKYFDVSIAFDQADEDKYYASIRCFTSQFTQQEMTDLIARERADLKNVLYFRRMAIYKGAHAESF